MIRGVPPCSYKMGRDRQSTRSRFEQPRLASPIFLGLANDKRIYELCNPQRFGNRAPPPTAAIAINNPDYLKYVVSLKEYMECPRPISSKNDYFCC
jgi:hypothetical protein